MLIDGVGPADQVAVELMDTVTEHVQAAEAARPPAPPLPTPPEYRRFLGLYRMLHVGDLPSRVEYRDGTLRLKDAGVLPFPGGPPTILEPTDNPLVFMVRNGRYAGEPLTFSLAEDGAVTGFRAAGFSFVHLLEVRSPLSYRPDLKCQRISTDCSTRPSGSRSRAGTSRGWQGGCASIHCRGTSRRSAPSGRARRLTCSTWALAAASG